MHPPLKAKNLTKQQESKICLSCGECCKRYWITVLPEEAKKVVRLKGMQLREFLENDCILNVKLYRKTTPGVLTYPTAFFPKRIYELLKKELGLVPQSFFVVPQVVLKREEKIVFNFLNKKSKKEMRSACVFLKPENVCGIYEARPEPCKLFPFIAMPDFREQYPFCLLYLKSSKDYSIESRIYYKKVQHYFKKVHESGFLGLWRHPPLTGLIFLGEKQIGKITLRELMEMTPLKDERK